MAYVVAKKGKVSARPGGVKGRYKLVDARMKKDRKKLKSKIKEKGGGRKKERKAKESKESKSSGKSSGKTGKKRQFRHRKSGKSKKFA